VEFAEELGAMSGGGLGWIALVGGPVWGIHSLTLMISCLNPTGSYHIWYERLDQHKDLHVVF